MCVWGGGGGGGSEEATCKLCILQRPNGLIKHPIPDRTGQSILTFNTGDLRELSTSVLEFDILGRTRIPQNRVFLEHILFPLHNSSFFSFKHVPFRRTKSKSKHEFFELFAIVH